MKIACSVKMLLVVLLLALQGQKANAVPIVVLDGPQIAVEIQSLDILGTLYDVAFTSVPNATFVGDTPGATAAVNAIVAALNTSTADFVRESISGVSVNNFGVQDSLSSTVRGVNFGGAGNWEPSTSTAFLGPIAQFSPVTLPEIPLPATLPLLGASLAALFGFRRRRTA